MTVTLIGFDYAGVPSVKITRDNIDPVNTPDSQVGAFLYNSKWAADVKVNFSYQFPDTPGQVYFPGGSNSGNYTWYSVSQTGTGTYAQWKYYKRDFFPASPYGVPLFDTKNIRIRNGRFVGEAMLKVSMTGYQQRGTKWASNAYAEKGWVFNYQDKIWSGVGTMTGLVLQSFYSDQFSTAIEIFRKAVVTWRLPGDETGIVDGSPRNPVPGQNSIYISSGGTFVAKPGFELFGATETQLAFDTSRIPAKVIGGNDIYLPVGVTAYDLGFGIPAGTIADVHYYDGSTITFPCAPSTNDYGAEYWFEGQHMFFNNTLRPCRARFIVISYDGSGQTSGDNNVLRQFNWNGQNVVQILKPGASQNPSLADIALDSRWPCLQILAEGSFGVGDGAQVVDIPFNGTGTFPMVKFMTLHGGRDGTEDRYDKAVKRPFVSYVGVDRIGGPAPIPAGDCSYCELTQNNARFRTFKGAPVRMFYQNFDDFDRNRISYEYDNSIYGIRYYIFGIPQP